MYAFIEKSNSQRGQVLLIIVLVMVVALTVGLSLVSRTITNLRSAQEEESSQRAFSAAEAGIERALQSNTNIANDEFATDTKIIQTNITQIEGSKFVLNGGNPVKKNEGVDIWLTNYPDYTQFGGVPFSPQFFSVYFGSTNSADSCSTNNAPAVEVIVFTGSISTPGSIQSKRYVFDPCETPTRGNGFAVAETGSFSITNPSGNITFPYRTPSTGTSSISITSGILLRVVPIYKNTPIGIYACNDGGNNCTALPNQGKRIDSVGESGTTRRKIIYYQAYESLPSEFFQYGIFASQ